MGSEKITAGREPKAFKDLATSTAMAIMTNDKAALTTNTITNTTITINTEVKTSTISIATNVWTAVSLQTTIRRTAPTPLYFMRSSEFLNRNDMAGPICCFRWENLDCNFKNI